MSDKETQNTSDKVQFEFMDVKTLQECNMFLKSSLDQALQKGCYSLNQTEKLLLSLNSLSKGVELLDKYQTFVLSKIKENDAVDPKSSQTQQGKKKVKYADE